MRRHPRRWLAVASACALVIAACGDDDDDDGDGGRAGADTVLEVELSYRVTPRPYMPFVEETVTDLQSQLAEVGIEVTLDEQDPTGFIDNLNAGNIGMHVVGWNVDFPDPDNIWGYHFGPGGSPQFGTGFDDIHQTLTDALTETDEDTRAGLYAQANELLAEHVPAIPLAYGVSAVAYRADVENAHASPLANEYFAPMSVEGEDTFVWMQQAEPGGSYCPDESDGESLRLCEQIYEPLLGYEVGGVDVVPLLAEDLPESNDDGTEYTFTLRDDVTFHDGQELHANDVVASYQVAGDEGHPLHIGREGLFSYWDGLWGGFANTPADQAGDVTGDDLLTWDVSDQCGTEEYGGIIASIEAVDESTVRFTLCQPDAAFEQKVAFATNAIYQRDFLAENAGDEALYRQANGTGPYRLETWREGDQVILTSYEDYWGDPAQSEQLIFRWNEEPTARLSELQSGQVHGIDNVGTEDFETIESDDNLQLLPREPLLNVAYLGFNVDEEPFDDPLVRQAIAHAIDRERLVENFYPEGSLVASQILPPELVGHDEGFTDFEYDPDRARELLAEAGYGEG